jgi:hypothetical protein
MAAAEMRVGNGVFGKARASPDWRLLHMPKGPVPEGNLGGLRPQLSSTSGVGGAFSLPVPSIEDGENSKALVGSL